MQLSSRSSLVLLALLTLLLVACGSRRRYLASTPPAAPTGLVASSDGFHVDLDWDDNVDVDLVGYRVYRAPLASGPFALLTPTLVTTSDYQDTTVLSGQTYHYAVTAEDHWQNESTRSAAVSVLVSLEHQNPDGTIWFSEASGGGIAAELFIEELVWGRSVDVRDGLGDLRHRDYLIGDDIQSDGVDYQLDSDPITDVASLTILHAAGTPAYQLAFERLTLNLGVVATKAPEGDLPPFSMVPRNASLGVRFSDVIDPGTLNATTLRVQVGTPPSAPFDARLAIDPNYGAEVAGQFFPTRARIDMTVSELESISTLLPINTIGLPPSKTTALANVALRIPTQVDFGSGQFQILANIAGNGLATVGNGPVDFASLTVDVLRGLRSGGDSAITGDAYNGFLMDVEAPRIVGSQPVNLSSVGPDLSGGADDYLVTFQYQSLTCAAALVIGDVLELPGVFAQVTEATPAAPFGLIIDAKVKLVAGDPVAFVPGAAQLHSLFDKAGGDSSECFIAFAPGAAAPPTLFVSPSAQVLLRFSEPMAADSGGPFDSLTLTSVPSAASFHDYVVGELGSSADLKQFRFVPSLPLSHISGTAEVFYVNVVAGPLGFTDLAGNALAEATDQVQFTLNPLAPTATSGGLVLRFSAPNEDGDLDGSVELTEYSGQFMQAVGLELIRPRPVSRSSLALDASQTAPGAMFQLTTGLQTPLVPLGSRMMGLWRYLDAGWAVDDPTLYNMDVEGLSWAPFGGLVSADYFEEFEINLAHAVQLPDEHLSPVSLLPTKPASGLTSGPFLDNVLPDPVHGQVTVHPKAAGYLIDPTDLYVGASGTTLMPWPMNAGLPEADWSFYTWRDTAIQARGGANGYGIPTRIEESLGLISGDTAVLGQSRGSIAGAGSVPSIGLPLLMEFKCYPSGNALGLNGIDVAIAINSSPKPTFRAYSSGGYNTSGVAVIKDPDTQPIPTGGFVSDPASGAPLGAPTAPYDNVFHNGQLDLVVRVSRTTTRWFDTGESVPGYLAPVVEPTPHQQPVGTQLVVDYRGATSVAGTPQALKNPLLNADSLNAHGDKYPGIGAAPYPNLIFLNQGITFLVDDTWTDDVHAIDGARYLQLRFTFIADSVTGSLPELASFGLAFQRNS